MTKHLNSKVLRTIQDGAFRRIPAKRREKTNLYVMDEIQLTKSEIKAGHKTIKIRRPTAVVFVDDEPMANWAHDCHYLLHDAETGKLYKEIKASFPPNIVNPEESLTAFHTPVVAFNPLRKIWQLEPKSKLRFPFKMRKGKRYAILFSGASNNRHTNDMEFLYRELVDQFFFDENDITVLNYDGTINYSGSPKPVSTWPGDGTPYQMVVNHAGTKAALEQAIDSLKTKLKKDDLLLIHTNNHGGHNGWDSYLCDYSGSIYTASDFANKISELPQYADLVVMMEQCHSGGFNDAIIENSTADRTTFAGACTERKNSIGGAHFDPFAQNWISALAGTDPYGAALISNPDYDNSGKISAREAFSYADDVHDSYDSPVYSAYGVDAGDQHLHQKWRSLFLHHDFILKELTILHDGIEDPIHYRKVMRTKILPALAELDDQLAVKPVESEKAQKMIGQIIYSIAKEIGAHHKELENLIH